MKALSRFFLHPLTLRILGIGLGVLFLLASIHKIAYPDRFAENVNEYQLLPLLFVNPFSFILPWVEAIAGLFLIIGIWRRAAGLITVVLSIAFLFAIAWAAAKGLDVECGCFEFGGAQASKAGWGIFTRDAFILIPALLVWRKG